MILLWGLRGEGPMAAVLAALRRRGADVLMVDQRAYPTVSGSVTAGEDGVTGWIAATGHRRPVTGITGYYLRPYPVADRYRRGMTQRQVVDIDYLMTTLAEVLPPRVAVVNRPSAMASNDSKPAQLVLIRRQGFEVPDTLVTNDRDEAEEFWRLHRTVVYKSTSGIRSIAATLDEGHRDRLDHLATCPTQFQEFVPGDDYRVHVVGSRVFATRITSSATDYR